MGDEQIGHGIIQIILDEAHLLNITVRPQSQGRGLGLQLLEHLMQRARQLGAGECFLEVRKATRVLTASTSAMASMKSAAGVTTIRPPVGARMPW